MTKITVIMPVFNGERYLKDAIDSILNQTFTDFKLIVLNDNSTDSTAQILDHYQKTDPRVEVIHKTKNEGPANLRNEGIERAQSEFIALMDADDISEPDRFEKQLQVFENHPEIGVCGTWFTFFGDKSKMVKHAVHPEDIKIQFLSSCVIGNPTIMFKKSVLNGLRFEHQYVPAEDYGLWSQIAQKTKFYNIPESLLKYRWHPNNISQTKKENLRKANMAIRKKQLESFGADQSLFSLDDYLHAVSLKRKLPVEDVIATIKAAEILKSTNSRSQYYDERLFVQHIDKVIVRTLRNAKNYNKTLYGFVKKETKYFSKMPLVDKLIFTLKCLLKKTLFKVLPFSSKVAILYIVVHKCFLILCKSPSLLF